MKRYEIDVVILVICVIFTAGLFIGGFIAPPPGEIHQSVLKAGGIMVAFATIAMTRQTIKDGRETHIKKGDFEIEIGENHRLDFLEGHGCGNEKQKTDSAGD